MPLTAVLRDLNKLNTFVRVAQRRSFTKAAAELRTTPSVVSKRMKELEESLGFSLLNRSTHGLVLTDAGEGLFQQCLEMLARLDDLRHRDDETSRPDHSAHCAFRRRATMRDPFSHLSTTRFVQKRPGVRVHLSVVPENVISAEDGFDVIVSSQKPSLPGLVAHDLGAIRHVICGSPDYFRKFGRPKTPQDLADAQLSRRPVFGPEKLAVSKLLPAAPRRGQGVAVVQQQCRPHPDGAQRLPGSSGCRSMPLRPKLPTRGSMSSSRTFRFRRNECAHTTQR